MMKNKMRSGRTTTPMGNTNPAPGVYGECSAPTVSEYKQDDSVAGKFKTAETTMGSPMRQVNQMRRGVSTASRSPVNIKTSNAKKSKNTYRRATGTGRMKDSI